MKRVKQADLRIAVARQDCGVLKDRLQCRGGIGIAGFLAAGKRAGLAPQIGQIAGDGGDLIRQDLCLHQLLSI